MGIRYMKWTYLLVVPLACVPLAPPVAFAQNSPVQTQAAADTAPADNSAAQPAAPALSQAQLEQMLAPIALYPDELLTQVLVASTYPLEVVMAHQWLTKPENKDLTGDALLKALDAQDWDPSVKSLVPFPSVLQMMTDQLDWTQQLGDAFLAQQSDVFAAVQELRQRAQSAGTLKSNDQQVVTTDPADPAAIVIQPAQPSTVYVPVYNPTVVYGAWPYAAYPPVYYPPPPGAYMGSALLTGMAFGVGIAITSSLWGWGSPSWGRGNVNVNVNHFNSINSNRYNNFHPKRTANTSNVWQHNAEHRRGVSYGNPNLNRQYRPASAGNAAQRDAFRGRTPPGQGNALNAARPGGGNAVNRPNPQRPNVANGGSRPNVQRPNAGNGGSHPNIQRPNAGNGGGHSNFQRPNGGR